MNSTEENTTVTKKSLRRPLLILSVILLILIAGLLLAFSFLSKAGKGTQKTASQSITMPAGKKISIPAPKTENKIVSPVSPNAMTENEKLGDASAPPEKVEKSTDTASLENAPIPVKTDASPGVKDNEENPADPVSSPALAEKTVPPPLPKKTGQPKADVQKKSDETSGKIASSKKMIKIETHVSQETLALDILSDGNIQDYNHFFLKSPPRLVIDLIGKWEKPEQTGIAVESDLVKKIRIWPHPDKLRIVSDLKKEELQTPAFTPISNGLSVTLKKK